MVDRRWTGMGDGIDTTVRMKRYSKAQPCTVPCMTDSSDMRGNGSERGGTVVR